MPPHSQYTGQSVSLMITYRPTSSSKICWRTSSLNSGNCRRLKAGEPWLPASAGSIVEER